MNKAITLILLFGGIALAYWGYDMYSSVGAKLERVGGNESIEAWAAMVAGGVFAIIGVSRLK